jgi:hypothetical protein
VARSLVVLAALITAGCGSGASPTATTYSISPADAQKVLARLHTPTGFRASPQCSFAATETRQTEACFDRRLSIPLDLRATDTLVRAVGAAPLPGKTHCFPLHGARELIQLNPCSSLATFDGERVLVFVTSVVRVTPHGPTSTTKAFAGRPGRPHGQRGTDIDIVAVGKRTS